MKITINGKEIKLTDEQLAVLKEEIKREEAEWPKVGDEYLFLYHTGMSRDIWRGNYVDEFRKSRGNIFRNSTEALKADQKRIALTTIWAYWEKHCKWEVDWRKETQDKFCINYNYCNNEFNTEAWGYSQYCPFLPVYKSEEQAKYALNALTPEYKLLFDVV